MIKRAAQNRRNASRFEVILWRHLSNSKCGGYKFRRQAAIDRYIADFLCPSKALIVEVDGDTHDLQRDRIRDDRLAALGYHTLRFSNLEVANNIDGVLYRIREALTAAPDRWP